MWDTNIWIFNIICMFPPFFPSISWYLYIAFLHPWCLSCWSKPHYFDFLFKGTYLWQMIFSKSGPSTILGPSCSSITLLLPLFPLPLKLDTDCGGRDTVTSEAKSSKAIQLPSGSVWFPTLPWEPSPGPRERLQVGVLATSPAKISANSQHQMPLGKGMRSQMIPSLSLGVFQLRPQTFWNKDKLSLLCAVWISHLQKPWAKQMIVSYH